MRRPFGSEAVRCGFSFFLFCVTVSRLSPFFDSPVFRAFAPLLLRVLRFPTSSCFCSPSLFPCIPSPLSRCSAPLIARFVTSSVRREKEKVRQRQNETAQKRKVEKTNKERRETAKGPEIDEVKKRQSEQAALRISKKANTKKQGR